MNIKSLSKIFKTPRINEKSFSDFIKNAFKDKTEKIKEYEEKLKSLKIDELKNSIQTDIEFFEKQIDKNNEEIKTLELALLEEKDDVVIDAINEQIKRYKLNNDYLNNQTKKVFLEYLSKKDPTNQSLQTDIAQADNVSTKINDQEINILDGLLENPKSISDPKIRGYIETIMAAKDIETERQKVLTRKYNELKQKLEKIKEKNKEKVNEETLKLIEAEYLKEQNNLTTIDYKKIAEIEKQKALKQNKEIIQKRNENGNFDVFIKLSTNAEFIKKLNEEGANVGELLNSNKDSGNFDIVTVGKANNIYTEPYLENLSSNKSTYQIDVGRFYNKLKSTGGNKSKTPRYKTVLRKTRRK